jgi:hypothetical protein
MAHPFSSNPRAMASLPNINRRIVRSFLVPFRLIVRRYRVYDTVGLQSNTFAAKKKGHELLQRLMLKPLTAPMHFIFCLAWW